MNGTVGFVARACAPYNATDIEKREKESVCVVLAVDRAWHCIYFESHVIWRKMPAEKCASEPNERNHFSHIVNFMKRYDGTDYRRARLSSV